MRYIPVSLIIGATLLWCASPLRAYEASKSAKAAELLQLMRGDQMMQMMEPMMKGMLAQADKDMPAGTAQPVPESTSLVTAFTMLLRPADFFRMEVMWNFGRSLFPDADSAQSDLRGLAL